LGCSSCSGTLLRHAHGAGSKRLADDYEDVEQLYLYANREFAESAQVRVPLRDIVGEITNMLREGYIEAKYSNDEELAPLRPIDFTALYHYWFGATDKGK